SCSHVQPSFRRMHRRLKSGRVTARRERVVCDISVSTARSDAPGRSLVSAWLPVEFSEAIALQP
ncbi:hypothetical protein ACLRGI_17575, partial [Paenarthrobacter nitroguajacolicus]|uniref:hypothetical protein n=1 Tax=Paenarthrobacter nitroguajacolicus TaxID=211146 RepID=UPI003AE2656A